MLIFEESLNMRYTVIIFLTLAFCLVSFKTSDSPITKDCKCKNIPLTGRVRVVKRLATFQVQIVNALPDLEVKIVPSLPKDCGEWQFVDGLEDFSIEYVDALPDFTIRFVDALPGVN
jgi:hypothetical protein